MSRRFFDVELINIGHNGKKRVKIAVSASGYGEAGSKVTGWLKELGLYCGVTDHRTIWAVYQIIEGPSDGILICSSDELARRILDSRTKRVLERRKNGKGKRVEFRVTAEEDFKIKQAAKKKGMSVSDFVRSVILR